MADFSFRKQMAALGVDTSTMTIVDQAPADDAVCWQMVLLQWHVSLVVTQRDRW